MAVKDIVLDLAIRYGFQVLGALVILAAGAIVWLLSQATWKEFAIEAIVLVAASGLYVTAGRRSFRR